MQLFTYYSMNLVTFLTLSLSPQNETPAAIAPAATSLQLLQQLQASSGAATPVSANPAPTGLTSVQHQLLLQQHLGLSAVAPSPSASAAAAQAAAAAAAVPSAQEMSPANLQSLATLASLSSSGEYGQCRIMLLFFHLLVYIVQKDVEGRLGG